MPLLLQKVSLTDIKSKMEFEDNRIEYRGRSNSEKGTAWSPGLECYGNLKQLYSQEPHCLCLLLNGTNLSFFPINKTLAL
ncbi:hypothetical protein Fmac_015166 [Flemingia macrophylla]|uniref:Bifunctional inhibitor/plant lipid transfer protein/seed storage helical domain-containing protein n=1 Tax=Flemingia macrophylla TaxID=520843 RepID=A0ABD1MDT3_9FABA